MCISGATFQRWEMSCIGQSSEVSSDQSQRTSVPLSTAHNTATISSILKPRSSEEDCLPLPVVSLSTPTLRKWRVTQEGLVPTMGQFLDKPKTAKTNDSGAGNGVKYAMSSMQGWRIDMEDAHVVEVSMADHEPYKNWSFFAVFDGHAGNSAADNAAENILQTLISTDQFEKVTTALKLNDGVLTTECIALLEEGIKSGFLSLDERIRQRLNTNRSGSTAVCAILTPSHIIIANLGDSRAVLARKEEDAFGTEDHKPYHDRERQRIEDAGGSVMIQRVNGTLAVSRAFGDFEYKSVPGLSASQQLVSPEPDVYVLERDAEKDEFMVLACDGVYDVMENDELAKFVRGRLNVHTDLNLVCNEVLDACLTRGSRDNMTMIVVCFAGAPGIDPIKAAEEEIWLKSMNQAIDEVVSAAVNREDYKKDDELNTDWLLRQLSSNPTTPNAQAGPAHVTRSLLDQVLTARGIKHD